MATNAFYTGSGDEPVKSKKRARVYFYLDNKLYKKLRVDNGHDSMTCWCYDDAQVVELSLAYVKKKRKPTYTITQAAAFLDRSRMNINHLYLFGVIKKPKRSYSIENPTQKDAGQYRLSEQDVYDLHAYYRASRKYQTFERSARPLPSRQQLASMMRYEKVQYVRTKDGEFVPLWRAPDIEEWL